MGCTFEAKLDRPPGVGSWTIVTAPFSVEEEFGTRGRVPVKGRIDDQPFQGSLMPHGDGRHFIVVNKAIRDAIGKESGDVVRVVLERDDAPRVVVLPEAFAAALNKAKKAKAAFEALPPSHRKEYAEWIAEAKKAETQARRIEEALAMIGAGQRLKQRCVDRGLGGI